MTPPSSSRFPRALRSHDLLLLAPNHFPPLELGQRSALFDPDDVVHLVLVGLVVGVVFFRAPHRLLHDRMGEAALDTHHYGLVLLVAYHDARSMRFGISDYSGLAFERVARFGLAADSFFRGAVVAAGAARPERFCAAIVLIRAMSRRTCRTRAVFSSCPVAR